MLDKVLILSASAGAGHICAAQALERAFLQTNDAREEARIYLEAIGILSTKITVSGIPIDPVFAEKKDKQAMRHKHGLKPDLPTILMSAGGFGVGAMDGLISALQPVQHAAQVVAICGRNEELKNASPIG